MLHESRVHGICPSFTGRRKMMSVNYSGLQFFLPPLPCRLEAAGTLHDVEGIKQQEAVQGYY
jgi:hypothetical protein